MTKNKKFDVDIDFSSKFSPQDVFPESITASMVDKDRLKKHPSGVYFQDIPRDKITGLCAIPYKEADNFGYFKFDFLHLILLDNFKSKEEIRNLIKIEPDWTLLEDMKVVEKLSQIHRHYDLVVKLNPKSIDDLADLLALIRPSKRFLVDYYIDNKELARIELYKKPDNPKKYYFKRGHAISYSLNIVLQLHLIKMGLI